MNTLKSKPTDRQLEWMDCEIGVIIHYLISSYDTTVNYRTKEVRTKLPPSVFAPNGWDTDQWVRAAHNAGAKYAVIVAKHVEGFALWPTKVNDYSVAGCSYKEGKGDVIRDFLDSCKKYGIKPGIYYSLRDNAYYGINNKEITAADLTTDWYREYIKVVEAQVTELWSEYGELFEIWFDGGIIPLKKGGPDIVPILEKYQPNAICFQGPYEHAHNVRWGGNERAEIPETSWPTTNAGRGDFDGETEEEDAGVGTPNGRYFWPIEGDLPNRHQKKALRGGWVWKAGEEEHLYTPEHLFRKYLSSVGHGANMLIGMAIATSGRFEDEEQLVSFGKKIEESFGQGARIIHMEGGESLDYTIEIPEDRQASYLVIREDMTNGHNIRGYEVYCDSEKIYEGESIGHKRIIPLPQKKIGRIAFKISKTADTPKIRDIEVY